jgi:MinD-like ATPase involved in chromosome partitioning or flagellar assembly
MEGIEKKNTIICFFGARKNIGAGTASLNLAVELIKRNFKVIFGNSFESNKDFSFLLNDNAYKEERGIYFRPSKIEGLKLLSFSNDASKMSPQKIEELLVGLPEKIGEHGDFLIFNINDPFNFPDRYILLNTDIHVIVAKVESTIFSDIFQQLEKLAFLPVKPKKLCLIFNQTRDLDMAFETYLELVKQAEELKLNIKLYFLGILPNDLLRQNISAQLKLPARLAFPESSFKGAVSFIAEKIIRLSNVAEQTGEAEPETMLLEEN